MFLRRIPVYIKCARPTKERKFQSQQQLPTTRGENGTLTFRRVFVRLT